MSAAPGSATKLAPSDSGRLKQWREEHDGVGGEGEGDDEQDLIDDPPALWIRPVIWFLDTLILIVSAVTNNGYLKLAYAVVDSLIYSALKAPFALRSYLKRAHGDRVWRNCAYGPRPRNKLDVYLPDPDRGVGRFGDSVILFVHGGAWYWGSKTYHSLMQCSSFPDSTVVCMNYSLHPHAQVQTMCHDISLAIKWVHENVCMKDERWWHEGKRGAPLVLVAHSAGAHLVALTLSLRCGLGPPPPFPHLHRPECMVAERRCGCCPSCPVAHAQCPDLRAAGPWGWSPGDVLAFVGMSGVYKISDHFLHESKRGVANISPMCGSTKSPLTPAGKAPPVMGTKRENWDCHSPTALVGGLISKARSRELVRLRSLPATFLIHGTKDTTVPFTSSVRFFEALTMAGHPRVSFRGVAGGGHGDVCMDLTEVGAGLSAMMASEIRACIQQAQLTDNSKWLDTLDSGGADLPPAPPQAVRGWGGTWRGAELVLWACVCVAGGVWGVGDAGLRAAAGAWVVAASLCVLVHCVRSEAALVRRLRALETGGWWQERGTSVSSKWRD